MNEKYYGVDVSKDHLDVACGGRVERIENTKGAIMKFIKGMPLGSVVAMEATNTYYLEMADACYVMGMRVYVINPKITRHYREIRSRRGHTDRIDALTISEFIKKEHDQLRVYVPRTQDQRRLQTLIKRRSKLVSVKVQLTQSMRGIKEIKKELDAVVKRIDLLIKSIEALVEIQLAENRDRKRIAGIAGVGPVVSAALICDLESCEFRNADAFVAFYGLDPRPNESGKFRGRRKLSKQGQRIGRMLLYNAAMSAVTTEAWKSIYKSYVDRGLSKIQSLIIIARRIAKTAWSIYTHKTTFDPARLSCA